MRHLLPSLVLAAVAAFALAPAEAQVMPEKLSPMGEKIEAAVKGSIRPPEDVARDAERKPRQTLEFMGLKDDQRVIELIPAGGYFTKILGPVLKDKGELWVAIGTSRLEPVLKTTPGLEKVKVAPANAKMSPAAGKMGLFDISEFSLGVQAVDLVVTFRNYHNLTASGRANLDKAVFAALKSGGHYAILDHTRRHNEPDNTENWRRVDPVLAIKEVQAAGFVFEGFSNLHYTPDDEMLYEVGRKSVTGNTDRFILRFRKP